MRSSWFPLVLIACSLAPAAHGDAVLLKNGDRISGTVKSMKDGVLTIATEYAGDVSISRDAVESVETDAPVAVLLPGDMVETVRLQAPGDGEEQDPWTQAVALAADETALRKLTKPKYWSGSVGLGLTMRSGNTDTTDFAFNASTAYARGDHRFTLGLSMEYGEAEDLLNTRRYRGDARYQHYFVPRFYGYLLAGAERDDGRKLDLRLEGGGGLGYEVLARERTSLSFEGGLTYVHEEWNPFTPWERDVFKDATRLGALNGLSTLFNNIASGALPAALSSFDPLPGLVGDLVDPLADHPGRTEDFIALHAGLGFEKKLFAASTLTETIEVQSSLEDLGDYRLTSLFAFNVPLGAHLAMQLGIESEYYSLAEEQGIDSWDHQIRTTLQYNF